MPCSVFFFRHTIWLLSRIFKEVYLLWLSVVQHEPWWTFKADPVELMPQVFGL